MIGFAEYRQHATAIALQIVAVRFEGGDELHHIVEHLLHDEMQGEVRRMSREAVVEYITQNGVGSVVTRDSYGNKVDVVFERVAGRIWLRTRADGRFDDNLYSFYRFEKPNPVAGTFHAVAMNYTGDRKPSHLDDLIIFSDSAGTAEVVRRAALVKRIEDTPGNYVVETPRIPRSVLTVDRSGATPVVRAGQSIVEDLLFQLPRHRGNITEL